jgi:type II secretory pathway component GspD/PulD (secretin)
VAVTQLRPLFPKLHFIPDDAQKLITFTARETTHATITKILHKWDKPSHQIRFHTHIYEISETVLKNSQGLLSGLIDPISLSHTIGSSTVTPLNAIISHLQFLESTGEASLVAHPMIVTGLLNQAEIKIGDKIPYESSVSNGNLLTYHMSQMDTGIHLTITPKLINENQAIITDLDLKIESVKVWKQLQHSDFPILSKRWVKSTVTLQNETPFIIAGLTETSHKKNTSMPTFLKKIPLLSQRMKNNITSTDLLIIIYPEILRSNAF